MTKISILPAPSARPWTVLVLLALLLAGCSGDEQEQPEQAAPTSAVTLDMEFAQDAAVPGSTLQVMYRLKIAEGWHLYAPLLNDSGYPPAVELQLPAGWQAGPLRWPAPERYLMPGEILDHVYHDELLLVQDWTIPESAEVGAPVQVGVKLSWLACRRECVPGQESREVTVPVAAQARPTVVAGTRARALAAVPSPAPAGAVQVAKNKSEIILTVPGARELEFYPAEDCVPLLDLISDGRATGETLTLRLKAGPEQDRSLRGILHQRLADGGTRNWLIETRPGG